MWAAVTISDNLVEWAIGLLALQLISAIAWAVRLQMQVSALRNEVSEMRLQQTAIAAEMKADRAVNDRTEGRVAVLEEQHRNVFRSLERIESKLDRLVGGK